MRQTLILRAFEI